MKTITALITLSDQEYITLINILYNNNFLLNPEYLTIDNFNEINIKASEKLQQYLKKEIAIQKMMETG